MLVIGIDPARVPGPWDPAPVLAAIERGLAEFAAHGVGVRCCLVGLDGSDDVDAVVVEALLASSWECVVLGGGLKAVESRPGLHDDVVALVRRHAPEVPLAFSHRPEAMWTAASSMSDRVSRGRGAGPVASAGPCCPRPTAR